MAKNDKEETKTIVLELLAFAAGCLLRWWKGSPGKGSK